MQRYEEIAVTAIGLSPHRLTQPISITDLHKPDVENVKREFRLINNYSNVATTQSEAKLTHNKSKNRFLNIYPCKIFIFFLNSAFICECHKR